jgi:AcrR family transcriptional regulator
MTADPRLAPDLAPAALPVAVRRGRPAVADRRSLARIAMDLFEAEGFDAVTMDDIAAAAGLSRRTLFRMFPSKADLVWSGSELRAADLAARAAAIPSEPRTLASVVNEVLIPVLGPFDQPEAAAMVRRQLRLIAATTGLIHHRSILEMYTVLGEVIERTGAAGGAPPMLVADTLVGAAYSAILWWAVSDSTESPTEVLRETLAVLAHAV